MHSVPFRTDARRPQRLPSVPSGSHTLEGPVAIILQFIRPGAAAFDEFATRAMGEAFDTACAELQDSNLPKPVREIIAERIIEAAKRGERDRKYLCNIAIATIGGERKSG